MATSKTQHQAVLLAIDGHGELATEVEQATGKHGIRALGGYLGKILDKVVLAGAGSATAAAIPLIFPA